MSTRFPPADVFIFTLKCVILHQRALYFSNLFLSSPPANLVFHQTVERIHVGKKFGDIPRGIFIVRGENVVLLGEIVSVLVLCVCVCVGVIEEAKLDGRWLIIYILYINKIMSFTTRLLLPNESALCFCLMALL